jgi:hypothetical protein
MSGVPVLTVGSTCPCTWGGMISIGMPGQVKVDTTG